jgi:hypothetical protein
MKTKVAVVAIGGMVALVLLLHYFALSRTGLPAGWMLYLGLPVTAAGVLFALSLANLGAGWATRTDDVQPRVDQPPWRRIFQRTKPR